VVPEKTPNKESSQATVTHQ